MGANRKPGNCTQKEMFEACVDARGKGWYDPRVQYDVVKRMVRNGWIIKSTVGRPRLRLAVPQREEIHEMLDYDS